MLTSLRQRLQKDEDGFTLIELMVVVLIIAILLAIAVPVFKRQQDSTYDAQAKSAVRNLVTHLEACWSDQQTYANCDTDAKLGGTGLEWGPGGGQVQITVAGQKTFVAIANSTTGAQFWIQKSNNSYQRYCFTWPSPTPGCRSNGATW